MDSIESEDDNYSDHDRMSDDLDDLSRHGIEGLAGADEYNFTDEDEDEGDDGEFRLSGDGHKLKARSKLRGGLGTMFETRSYRILSYLLLLV